MMKQKSDVADKIIDGFDMYKELLVEQCVDELEEAIGKTKDGAEKEQVRQAVQSLGEMMAKGMEIYASIDAPTEVKDLFPTSDEIKSLGESMKLLPHETEELNESNN